MLRDMVAARAIPKMTELVKLTHGFVQSTSNIMKNAPIFYQMIMHLHIKDIKRDEAYVLAIKLAYHSDDQRRVIFENTHKNNKNTSPPLAAVTPYVRDGASSRPQPPHQQRPAARAGHVRTNGSQNSRTNGAGPNANMTPRKHLERELGIIHTGPSIVSVKVIKGDNFKEWLVAGKFDALLGNLGMNRPPHANGRAFCSGMIDEMEAWLKTIKRGVSGWVNKSRYAVIVYKREHAVSAMFCTVDCKPPASPVVCIEYVCTNKGHGLPLLKYAESDAKHRKASHIILHSMIDAIPFYSHPNLKYTRGPNACDLPLTPAQVDDAHIAWKALKTKFENDQIKGEKKLAVAKINLDAAQKALDKAVESGKNESIIKATNKKISTQVRFDIVEGVLGVVEERLSRVSEPDNWRGKLHDGSFTYKVPVLFSQDAKYPLPVFSKCLLSETDTLAYQTKKSVKSGFKRLVR